VTEYIVIALIALYVVSEVFHRKERGQLLNRLMAKNLPEFQYYETKFKKDVAEVEAVREEARVERKEAKKESEEEDDPNDDY
jgi:hypothetical protein